MSLQFRERKQESNPLPDGHATLHYSEEPTSGVEVDLAVAGGNRRRLLHELYERLALGT